MVDKALFSSDSTEWETPGWLFDLLDGEFHFSRDVCATDKNTKLMWRWTIDFDGLRQEWSGGPYWMNPPYGNQIKKWMKKAHESHLEHGSTIVCLVPARTDTKWWHDYVLPAHEVRYIYGRVAFLDPQGVPQTSPTFPSAIVIFRTRWWEEKR